MEYIYAAMLLHKAGKNVDEAGMKSVLTSAGVKADEGRVKATVSALKDVNIDEAIASAPTAVAAAPAAAAPPAGEAPAETPAEAEPKEEAKEASEEEASAGLGALFG